MGRRSPNARYVGDEVSVLLSWGHERFDAVIRAFPSSGGVLIEALRPSDDPEVENVFYVRFRDIA